MTNIFQHQPYHHILIKPNWHCDKWRTTWATRGALSWRLKLKSRKGGNETHKLIFCVTEDKQKRLSDRQEKSKKERKKTDKKVTISTNKHRWEKLLDTTHTPVLSSFNDSYQGFMCRCVAAGSGGVYYSNIRLYTLVENFTDKNTSNPNVIY